MPDRSANPLESVLEEVMACAASLRRVGRSQSGARGVSLPQQVVLEEIQQQPGLTVPQLARRRGTSRQSVQVLVDRLAGAGVLRYVANPDHRRSECLQLTASGRRALSSSRRSQDAWLSGLQTEVTEDQVRTCLELLRSIRVKLGGRRPVPSELAAPVPPRGPGGRKHGFKPDAPAEPIVEAAEEPVEEALADASPPEELPFNLL